MTRVDRSVTVRRETSALHRGRPLVVTLYPKYMELRLKGTRGRAGVETATYEAIYERAVKLRVMLEDSKPARPRRKGST